MTRSRRIVVAVAGGAAVIASSFLTVVTHPTTYEFFCQFLWSPGFLLAWPICALFPKDIETGQGIYYGMGVLLFGAFVIWSAIIYFAILLFGRFTSSRAA